MTKLKNILLLLTGILALSFAFSTPAYAAICRGAHLAESPLHLSKKELISQIGSSVRIKTASKVTEDLKSLLESTLNSKSEKEMSQSEFNLLLEKLNLYAADKGVVIRSGLDTVGVFPEGLSQVMVSGLGKVEKGGRVGFAKRHELAHLFHVVQIRVILLETIRDTRTGLNREQAEKYLDAFEGGANYRQFEKAVTSISGSLHVFSKTSRSQAQYVAKVSAMLTGVKDAISKGMVRFKNGKTVYDIYALVLSKAPLVVGKSMGGLALRLPFILFAATYFANSSFQQRVNDFVSSAL